MSSFYGSLCLSVILLVLSAAVVAVTRFVRLKDKGKPDAVKILAAGVFLSGTVLLYPIMLARFEEGVGGAVKAAVIAILEGVQLFSGGADWKLILESTETLPTDFRAIYTWVAVALMVVAPILTVGIVLSFFKNVSAYARYWRYFRRDVYVFSELNKKSLTLAEDLLDHDPRRVVVFANAFAANSPSHGEWLERARKRGAICFKKDVLSVRFGMHHKKHLITFFFLEEDDSKNVRQAIELIAKYKNREYTRVYVFSETTAGEMLLNSADKGLVKVRRVNEVSSLIYRTLYDKGVDLFRDALPSEGTDEKTVSALILGMGQHGTEMTKALTWFCQMDGYRLELNAFDILPDADSLFEAECPELMEPRYNGDFTTFGEAHYHITVHPATDVHTKRFMDKVLTLPPVTYVFVALGNDERNITTAAALRSLFEREGIHPKIQTVVYHSEKKEALMRGVSNFQGQSYDFEFVGDLRESYSEEVILGSRVEKAALARHLQWKADREEDFWKFEYNYKSSSASAIHQKAVYLLDLPGARQRAADRSDRDRDALTCLEHRRWNAYTRTQGYCCAAKRNDLAKTHPNLVPFDELPEEIIAYDVIDVYYQEKDE